MSIPSEPVPAPAVVRALAAGADLTAVWVNGVGGVTYRAGSRYIKHEPLGPETDLAREAAKLRWASAFTRVPEVLATGRDDTHEWLVTAAIEGASAVDPAWIARPEVAVRAVGAGLRALHDALPVKACPFSWSVAERIVDASRRGIHVTAALADPPPIDRAVVCHGDACCPNTLLAADGSPIAHVDLGALGVADRWADIAVAAMSTEWNYGTGYEDLLIEAYGVEPDRERLAYYRELGNAT